MGMNLPDDNDYFSIDHVNQNTQALDIVGKPDEYKNTETYAVGDLRIYDNVLYKCTAAVETAETFDASKWEPTNVLSEIAEQNKNFKEYIPMKYVMTGNSDMHIKFKIADTSQPRAYITALVISQGGQPVILTIAIDIPTNTITSWNQITPINNSFGIQSVSIEDEGMWVNFSNDNIWGICQYWGTGISI